MKKRLLSFIIALCMIATMCPVSAFAAGSFVDTKGHWGEASVQRWADYGIVKGMDGTHFSPDSSMTRAQMATILANLLGLKDKAENPFTDVKSGAWYEDAVLKCAAAGIMKGTSNTTASPESLITREQACVMLARALSLADGSGSTSFSDAGNIADWAASAVKTMTDRGILNGKGDNTFAPKEHINRASVAAILDRAITAYANKSGETVTASDKGITLIAAPDVTVTGTAQDVYVAPGASGATKLDGVKVTGAVTMNAPGGTLELAGESTAAAVNVPETAKNATINIAKDASVDAFATQAADTKLNVEGKVQSADIAKGATNTAVAIAKDAEVGKLSSAADNVKVTGNGKINNMTVSDGKGVTVAGSVTIGNITNNSSDSMTHGDKVIAGTGSTKPSGGGGGSGGGGHTTNAKTAQTVADIEELAQDSSVDVINVADVDDRDMPASDIAKVTIEPANSNLIINLNGQSLGSVTIAGEAETTLTINPGTEDEPASTDAQIGSLTIDSPNATVVQNVPVNGDVIINDMATDTFKIGNSIIGKIIMALKNVGDKFNNNPAKIVVNDEEGAAAKIDAPTVEVKTAAPVSIAGNTDTKPAVKISGKGGIKPTVSIAGPVAKVTSENTKATVNVQTAESVKVEGSVATVNAEAEGSKIEVAPNAVITTVNTTEAATGATISGEGSVGTVTAKAETTIEAKVDNVNADAKTTIAPKATVKKVTATAEIVVNAPVKEVTVPKTASDVIIGGLAAITNITAKAPITVTAEKVSKVTVPADDTAETVKITTQVNIPLIQTSISITVDVTTEKAKVNKIDVDEKAQGSIAITVDSGSAQASARIDLVTAVGENVSVKPTGTSDDSLKVTQKAAAPKDTKFTAIQPTADGNGGSIAATANSENYEFSTDEGAKAWKPLSEAKNLAPGTYFVRVKAVLNDDGSVKTAESSAISFDLYKYISSDAIKVSQVGDVLFGKTITASVDGAADSDIEKYTWTINGMTREGQTLTLDDENFVGNRVSLTITCGNPGSVTYSGAEIMVVSDVSGFNAKLKEATTRRDDTSVRSVASVAAGEALEETEKWILAETAEALKTSIANCNGISKFSKPSAITDAINALTEAIANYDNGVKYGKTPVEVGVLRSQYRSELNEIAVRLTADGANAGDVAPGVKWMTSKEWNDLNTALTNAADTAALKKVKNNIDSTVKVGAPTDKAREALAAAKADAYALQHDASIYELKTGETETNLHPSVKWVPNGTRAKLDTAFTEAGNLTPTETTTLNAINKVLTPLQEAIEAYATKAGTAPLLTVTAVTANRNDEHQDAVAVKVTTSKPADSVTITAKSSAGTVTRTLKGPKTEWNETLELARAWGWTVGAVANLDADAPNPAEEASGVAAKNPSVDTDAQSLVIDGPHSADTGVNITLTATKNGDGTTYTWYKIQSSDVPAIDAEGWELISSSTEKTLTHKSDVAAKIWFKCELSGGTNTIKSAAFDVTFTEPVKPTHKVTFNWNYDNKSDTVTVTDGAKVNQPNTPGREGFKFDGWFTDANCTNRYDFDTATVTADTNLYAKWTAIPADKYTVTYNANGATGDVPAVAEYDSGTKVTVADKGNLTREGFDFTGWNTQADGNGTAYAAGATFNITASINLYAQWKQSTVAQKFTVTYNANEATGDVPAAAKYESGAKVTVADKGNLVKEGFDFTGWNTAANGSGDSYAAGAELTVTGDITLYAQWKESTVAQEFTVTYNANEATGDVPAAAKYESGAKVTVADKGNLVKEGFDFTGWNTAANGSGDSYAAGAELTVTGDITLYAQWKQGTPTPAATLSLTYTIGEDTKNIAADGTTTVEVIADTLEATTLATVTPKLATGGQFTDVSWKYTSSDVTEATNVEDGTPVGVRVDNSKALTFHGNMAADTYKFTCSYGEQNIEFTLKVSKTTTPMLSISADKTEVDVNETVKLDAIIAEPETYTYQWYVAENQATAPADDTKAWKEVAATQTYSYTPNAPTTGSNRTWFKCVASKNGNKITSNNIIGITVNDTVTPIEHVLSLTYTLSGDTQFKDIAIEDGKTYPVNVGTVITPKVDSNTVDATTVSWTGADAEAFDTDNAMAITVKENAQGNTYDLTCNYDADGDDTAEKSITFKINVEAQVTVTFDPQCEDAIGAPDPIKVNKGETVSEPTEPTRTGYKFGGWYTDEECTNLYSFSSAVTADITLYARWIDENATTYDVTFNYNDNVTKPKTIPVVEKEKVPAQDAPTYEGHNFGGWFTDPDCTEGYEFSFDTEVTTNLNLYAKWTVIKITVTFDTVYKVTPDVTAQEIDYGGSVEKPADPAYDNYNFIGWFLKDAEGNLSETAFDFDNTSVKTNITLVAKWKAQGSEPKTYKVTFSYGYGIANDTKDVELGKTVDKPADKTLDGYKFIGWYMDSDFNTEYLFNIPVTSDITLHAKWEKVTTYTVTFDLNYLSAPAAETKNVIEGEKVEKPNDPTRMNYTFGGWFKDKDCTQSWDFNVNTVNEGITLYAKWTQEEDPSKPSVEITAKVNGTEADTADVGQAITLEASATGITPDESTGYKWTVTATDSAAAGSIAGTAKSATYYPPYATAGKTVTITCEATDSTDNTKKATNTKTIKINALPTNPVKVTPSKGEATFANDVYTLPSDAATFKLEVDFDAAGAAGLDKDQKVDWYVGTTASGTKVENAAAIPTPDAETSYTCEVGFTSASTITDKVTCTVKVVKGTGEPDDASVEITAKVNGTEADTADVGQAITLEASATGITPDESTGYKWTVTATDSANAGSIDATVKNVTYYPPYATAEKTVTITCEATDSTDSTKKATNTKTIKINALPTNPVKVTPSKGEATFANDVYTLPSDAATFKLEVDFAAAGAAGLDKSQTVQWYTGTDTSAEANKVTNANSIAPPTSETTYTCKVGFTASGITDKVTCTVKVKPYTAPVGTGSFQVSNKKFETLAAAITEIGTATEGTINVLDNANVGTGAAIEDGKTITVDIAENKTLTVDNDLTVTGTLKITGKGNLTDSNSKIKGALNSGKTSGGLLVITNEGTATIGSGEGSDVKGKVLKAVEVESDVTLEPAVAKKANETYDDYLVMADFNKETGNEITEAITLLDDVTIAAGKTLTIKTGATVNLSGKAIKGTGDTSKLITEADNLYDTLKKETYTWVVSESIGSWVSSADLLKKAFDTANGTTGTNTGITATVTRDANATVPTYTITLNQKTVTSGIPTALTAIYGNLNADAVNGTAHTALVLKDVEVAGKQFITLKQEDEALKTFYPGCNHDGTTDNSFIFTTNGKSEKIKGYEAATSINAADGGYTFLIQPGMGNVTITIYEATGVNDADLTGSPTVLSKYIIDPSAITYNCDANSDIVKAFNAENALDSTGSKRDVDASKVIGAGIKVESITAKTLGTDLSRYAHYECTLKAPAVDGNGKGTLKNEVPAGLKDLMGIKDETKAKHTVVTLPYFQVNGIGATDTTDSHTSEVIVHQNNKALGTFYPDASSLSNSYIKGDDKSANYPVFQLHHDADWPGYSFVVQSAGTDDSSVDNKITLKVYKSSTGSPEATNGYVNPDTGSLISEYVFTASDINDAAFAEEPVTVTFNASYGENGATTVTGDAQVANGADYETLLTKVPDSVKNASRAGFEIEGWYTDEARETKVTTVAPKTNSDNTMTVYAKWVSTANVRLLKDGEKIPTIPATGVAEEGGTVWLSKAPLDSMPKKGEMVEDTYKITGDANPTIWNEFSSVESEKIGYYATVVLEVPEGTTITNTTDAKILAMKQNNETDWDYFGVGAFDDVSITPDPDMDANVLLAEDPKTNQKAFYLVKYLGGPETTSSDITSKKVEFKVDWTGLDTTDPDKVTTSTYKVDFSGVTLKPAQKLVVKKVPGNTSNRPGLASSDVDFDLYKSYTNNTTNEPFVLIHPESEGSAHPSTLAVCEEEW